MSSGIFGVGAALPDDVVANAAFVDRLDTSDEWIVRRTGIHERRWLNGTRSLADLAAEACAAALDDAHRDAAAVDRVIVSTITPDRLTPGLAPEVAALIGTGARAPAMSTPRAPASSPRSSRRPR